MTEQIIDEQMPTFTASQMADYWAWQVMIGRGQWIARLDPRGLDYRTKKDTTLNLVVPTSDQMYDEGNKVIFVAARF